MSNDKFDNTNGKGYDDLYSDLPKEVVDILMQTHPFSAKKDGEDTAHRSRRRRREDVEEIREARMQQISSEINEISKAPQQEGEPTRYVSPRRSRNAEHFSEDSYAPKGNRMDQEDYDDGIQYVSVMPAKKKSKKVEEVNVQTSGKRKKAKREKEVPLFDDMSRGKDRRPRYEDVDFDERAKREHLDNLYDDEYDADEYHEGGIPKLPLIVGILAVLLLLFLIFRTVSLGSQLEDAKNQLAQSQSYKEKYEQIQMEKMKVEEELEKLKNPSGSTTTENKPENNDTNSSENSTSSDSSSEYTIQQGDTMWTIAQKTLGNGADYQKILDANGMKEGETLRVGAKLKIPQA